MLRKLLRRILRTARADDQQQYTEGWRKNSLSSIWRRALCLLSPSSQVVFGFFLFGICAIRSTAATAAAAAAASVVPCAHNLRQLCKTIPDYSQHEFGGQLMIVAGDGGAG